MPIDFTQVGVVAITGLANLGGVMVLIRKYTGQVDEHNKVIPALTESLKTINETLKVTSKSLEELYASRNSHEVEITRIKTTHKINGCELPQGPPQRRHDDA